MAAIVHSEQWKKLAKHVEDVQRMHLRDLLQDEQRSASMILEHNGVYLDFSRQNATQETIKVDVVEFRHVYFTDIWKNYLYFVGSPRLNSTIQLHHHSLAVRWLSLPSSCSSSLISLKRQA